MTISTWATDRKVLGIDSNKHKISAYPSSSWDTEGEAVKGVKPDRALKEILQKVKRSPASADEAVTQSSQMTTEGHGDGAQQH